MTRVTRASIRRFVKLFAPIKNGIVAIDGVDCALTVDYTEIEELLTKLA